MRDFLSDLVHRTFEPEREIEPRPASRFESVPLGRAEHSLAFELASTTAPPEGRTIPTEDAAAAARSTRAGRTAKRAGDDSPYGESVAQMGSDAADRLLTRGLAADASAQETGHGREAARAAKAIALIAEEEARTPFARSAASVEPAPGPALQPPAVQAGSSPVASSATDSVVGSDSRSGLQGWRAAAEHSHALTPHATPSGGVFGPPAPPAPVRLAPEIVQAGAESSAAAAATLQDTPRSGQLRNLVQPPGVSPAENASQLLTPIPVVWNPSGSPSLPAALSPAAVTQSPGPTINVTIGRIEVRATPAPAPAKKTAPGGPVLTLNDYLRQRAGGDGR